MSHILIIGFGNPLRGDDGFGCLLANRLRGQLSDPAIEVIACQQLTPDLAERICGKAYVIFADASAEAIGCELHLSKLTRNCSETPDLSHHLDPQTLLTMARTLYGACPSAAFIVQAKAHELGYGEKLSPQMSGSLDKACRRVLELCVFLSPHAHLSPHPIVTHNA